MPHIDGRSGEVVIRIVYDGAPEAGKTSNVKELTRRIPLHRRGGAGSPGTRGERTEFFDWLDFVGGYVDGRRVRCQLVSVPGQANLLHRRRYLLDSADAVVFVASSAPDAMDEARASFVATLRVANAVGEVVPVGVIVQANKQDREGALAPADVARALGCPPVVPVVGSVASSGHGVMETFILAVRLATDRVRTLLLGDTIASIAATGDTPEALLAAMQELESDDEEPVGMEPAPPEPPAAFEAPPPPAPRVIANRIGGADRLALPNAQEISSGHVWPPVKGRAAIAAATSARLDTPATVEPWAPADAIELRSAEWVLHSSERWAFEAETDARFRLHFLVRRMVPMLDFLPEGRALAVARDGARWRLWVATPVETSLRDAALAALAEGQPAIFGALVRGVTAGVRALSELSAEGVFAASTAELTLQEGRLRVLSVDEGDGSRPREGDPIEELAELLRAHLRGRADLEKWVVEGVASR